jgi:hypothetical protein
MRLLGKLGDSRAQFIEFAGTSGSELSDIRASRY